MAGVRLVLGPDRVPVPTVAEQAAGMPELAVLSALAHGGAPEYRRVIDVLVKALSFAEEDRAISYLAALARAPLGLRSARAATLSPTAASRALRELVDLGLVETRQVILAEGRARTTEVSYANHTHPRWPELAPLLARVHPRRIRRHSRQWVPARLAHVFWNAPVRQIDLAVHGPVRCATGAA